MKTSIIITNIEKSIMGTMKFDAKFPGMRKAQNFIVYPMEKGAENIHVQSDSRYAIIDTTTGNAEITGSASGHHNSWLLYYQRAKGQTKLFTVPAADLSELKMKIFITAGMVGDHGIVSDNSAASDIL